MGDRTTFTLRLLGSWDATVQGPRVHTGSRQQRLLAAPAIHGPGPAGAQSPAGGISRCTTFTWVISSRSSGP